MLRGEWKERDEDDGVAEEDQMEGDEDIVETAGGNPSYLDTTHTGLQPQRSKQQKAKAKSQSTDKMDDQLDGLTSSMTSLSLVPPSIRFGRGGKSGGFGGGHLNGQSQMEAQNLNQSGQNPQPAAVGSAGVLGRGRGRGRIRGGFPMVIGNQVVPAAIPGAVKGLVPPSLGRGGIISLPRGRGRGTPRGRGGRGGNSNTAG